MQCIRQVVLSPDCHLESLNLAAFPCLVAPRADPTSVLRLLGGKDPASSQNAGRKLATGLRSRLRQPSVVNDPRGCTAYIAYSRPAGAAPLLPLHTSPSFSLSLALLEAAPGNRTFQGREQGSIVPGFSNDTNVVGVAKSDLQRNVDEEVNSKKSVKEKENAVIHQM